MPRGVQGTATVIGMVSDLRVAVRVRTGSCRIVDENGTVVAGDWANADGGRGLDFADHGRAN
jgi:hypothetical protein